MASRPSRPVRPQMLSRPSVNIRRSYNSLPIVDTLDLTRSATNPSPYPRSTSSSSPVLGAQSYSAEEPGSLPHRPAHAHHHLSTVEETETPRHELSAVNTNTNTNDASGSALTPIRTAPEIRVQDFEPVAPVRPPGRLRTASRNLLTLGRSQPAQADFNLEQKTNRSRANSKTSQPSQAQLDHDDNLVHLLDVIDPEVSTLSTLTNIQNSLFIPDLGPLLNRRATYNLTRSPSTIPNASPATVLDNAKSPAEQLQEEVDSRAEQAVLRRHSRTGSITSTLSESRFAVLPHGVSLEGWSEAEKAELNDLVRHLLHSKREGFKRGMKGFGQYVRKPLGLFVTVYAVLITLFGLAWVLFLIGWINVGGRQLYIINVIDNVLVALFAIMGDGLAPFRAYDTYHMIFIAHYTRKTWRLRKEKQLPKLHDHNDLPISNDNALLDESKKDPDADLEAGGLHALTSAEAREYVLTPAQQKKLEHHQKKFSRSHTFYKPHETETHFAFPIKLLIVIVVLLDMHSCLQISLGAVTWGIDYKVRSSVLTTVILCCSLACNITGGILISVGDKRTRKKEVKERMFRQQLTEDAMQKMEKRREKERARNHELDNHVDPLASDVDDINESTPEKKKLRKSMDVGRKSADRKSSDLQRKSVDRPRKSLDHRKSLDQS